MVLPPPPPLFRRHHHHHHHHLRYDNVLRPPDFVPPHHNHHLPPLPPPPPPPQAHPSHIHLPPPPPVLPPPPPLPVRHIEYPPRFNLSPPHRQIYERSHLDEFDPPQKPYFRHTVLPPPPYPPPRENLAVPNIQDYPERNPIFRDEIFRRSGVDYHIYELPETWDRNLQLEAREFHTRVPDFDIGDRERYRDIFNRSRELYRDRDDDERLDNGISERDSDSFNLRDYGERRWDSGVSDQGRDLYREMDYDERKWDSGLDDQGRDLYSERDYDERRWDNGTTNERDFELYCNRDDDERGWDSRRSNGVLLRLGKRKLDFVEDDLSLGRFSGRLGRRVSNREFNMSDMQSRLQKKRTVCRIQLGKYKNRYTEGYNKPQHIPQENRHVDDYKPPHVPQGLSRGRLKGKQKRAKILQSRMEDKREMEHCPLELDISFKSNALVAKAILAPSHTFTKSDVKKTSVSERSVYDIPGSLSEKSSNNVVLNLQSDSQETSQDLLDIAAVSARGGVTDMGVSALGKNFLKNAHLKVMNIQGPTVLRAGRACLRRLRKKNRARRKLLQKDNLKMVITSDEIMNAKDCIDSPSDVSQLNTAATLSSGNLSSAFIRLNPCPLPSLRGIVSGSADVSIDSSRPPVPELKREGSSLNTRTSSLCVVDNAVTECSGNAERSVTTTGEILYRSHEKFLVKENTNHGDSLGFNLHKNSVVKFGSNGDFLLDAENGGINEIPVLGGLMSDSSFVKEPSEVTFSIEGHDTADQSRPHETRIRKADEDIYSSENHDLISSPKLDYAVVQTPEDFTVSSSKDFLPDQENVFQVVEDANEFRSLEGAPDADCSNVGLGISTSSDLLSAEYGGIIPKFDVSSPVAFETNLSHYVDSVEGSPKVICNGEICLSSDCSSKTISKRKARGAQMGLSGKLTNMCVAKHLAEDLVPAVKVEFLGERDSSREDDSLIEGPSSVGDSSLEVDFGAFPGSRKKRKLSSPRLSLSSLSEDDSIADGLGINSPILDQQFTRLAEWRAEQREDTLSASTAINQCVFIDVEGKVGIDNIYISNPDDGSKSDGNDDLAFIANSMSLSADRDDICASNSGDELIASGFDMQSCMSSPEQMLFKGKFEASSACLSENEMICGSDNISNKKPVSADPNINFGKSLETTVDKLQTNADIPPSQLEDCSQVVKKLNPVHGKLTWSRNHQTSAVPRVLPGQHPLNLSDSRKSYPIHATNSRTWHRTGNSSVAVSEPKLQPSQVTQSHGTKAAARTTPSSYVRKGNSLVRNPSSSGTTPPIHVPSRSVYSLTPCTSTMKISQVSDLKTGDVNTPTLLKVEQVNTSEMIKAETLNHSQKSLNCPTCNLGGSLPVGNSPRSSCPCKTSDDLEERIKSSPVLECQTDSVINLDSQSTLEEGNSEKKIMYIKRRSNQLVATSNSVDTSLLGSDKHQASVSDGYYKSRQNQLVRASPKNHVRRGDVNVISDARVPVSSLTLPKTSTRSRRHSGSVKTGRSSKFSLVWKLHDTRSGEKDKNYLGAQKVRPHLFSSKRAACWRSLMLGTKSNNSSLSTISQKMLLSRKRGAIYTRSTYGYSLRMSKVLSVGGSSLKWSKSIERHSKKANEEATRAVAAAEKRKKDEKGAGPVASKSRNHVSRERIFRIGSERYKMDPTRRTLHRITDKEPSPLVAHQSEKNVKRSFIPRRLLIGNEQYVRIGNGNQLVRDPKKRTRVLASEKVRWSLRTARLRLARKRKYCQFFTKYGKCNKDNGKCPYVHDPSKIVVCTKFLSGSCSNSDCKLTHKVIPERMQDCSFFLKGSCSNENCPYRHVNVNPDSVVCESFLRGYCADGNECQKKHTYVCPAFEATGICLQASTCKLHHPKKKAEKKPTVEQKAVRGRYFDGGLVGLTDCTEATTEKLSSKGKADIVEGHFPDYISLDVSDEESHETTGPETSPL